MKYEINTTQTSPDRNGEILLSIGQNKNSIVSYNPPRRKGNREMKYLELIDNRMIRNLKRINKIFGEPYSISTNKREESKLKQVTRIRNWCLRFLTLFLVINAITTYAQTTTYSKTPPTIAPGSATGSFALNDFETVNLYNGGLNFNLPLMKIGGRGNAGYIMSLPIEHRWQIYTDSSTPGYLFHNIVYEWWTAAKPGYSPGILQARQTASVCNAPQDPVETVTNLTFTTVDGTEIELKDTIAYSEPQAGICPFNYPANGASRGNTFVSKDGSHITFISDSTIYDYIGANPGYSPYILSPSGYLMFKDGTKYRIDSGKVSWIQDKDGNRISFTYATQGVSTITDSLNRQIIIEYGVNEGAPYGIHDKITYKGTNGATRTIRISKGSLSDALKSGETLKAENQLFPNISNNPASVNPSDIVSSIWLPDGRRYQLFYNAYADLAKVVLPTGGAIEYDWSKNDAKGDGYAWVYSRVSERRVYPDGTNLTGKTTYSVSTETGNPIVIKQLAADNGQLAVSKKFFHSGDGAYVAAIQSPLPWNRGREYKSQMFTADETTLLVETNQTWIQDTPTWWQSYPDTSLNNPHISETTQKLADTNQVSKKTFSYDQFNNVTDTYEYDFGSGTAGAFLRRSHTDYVTDPNYVDYTGAHLRSLPTQSWVSSDAGGSNKVSLTQMEYDNYTNDANHSALVDRANASGHDTTNFGAGHPWRGNVTAVTSYANASAQTDPVTVFSQYDILGNIVKAIDAKGNVSTINYTDNFGAPDAEARTNSAPAGLNGQSTFAFATSATNPKGWTTYAQIDYFTGAGVDAEDINGVISSNFYNDALDRPTQSIVANNLPAHKQQTTIVYDDANRKVTSTSDLFTFNDNLAKSESFYDGLGRSVESRTYETGGGYIATMTEYDGLSRVKRVTNPYRPLQSEPQLWTESKYDALSRLVEVATPDNAKFLTSFSGNATIVTDQSNKQRRSITNALGQLTRIDEPNDNGELGLIDSPNQSTVYSYDASDNLTQVVQGGQIRIFSYDSLDRLKSANNPESGIVTYVYDANNNVVEKKDARSVTTAITYDSLNRPTAKVYSDGTPAISYVYDDVNISLSKGKLTKIVNSNSISEYTGFDALGRVLSSKQTTDGQNYLMSYTYDLGGNLIEETYPSGRKVKNTFDSNADLSKVETQATGGSYQTRADNFMYFASGSISSMKLGNNRWESTILNSRLQPTQIALGTAQNAADLLKLEYAYGTTDNNGNVKSQIITIPNGFTATQDYTYDSLNRLKTAIETVNSTQAWKQTFVYDRFGNRAFDLTNTTIPNQSGAVQAVINPSVDSANNRFTTSQGYVYDLSGNLVQDAEGRKYLFDGENKQTELRDAATDQVKATYSYDGDGRRIKKTVAATSEQTVFVYDADGDLVAEYLLTALTPQTPTTQYLTNDSLSSPRIITNGNGDVVSRRDFLPFGEDLLAGIGSRTQTLKYDVADNIRQKFTGKQRDNETNLDFFEARYFSPRWGRFVSPDEFTGGAEELIEFDGMMGHNPTFYAELAEPQSLNKYQYALNNPLRYVDPDGHQTTTADRVAPAPWWQTFDKATTDAIGRGVEDFVNTAYEGVKTIGRAVGNFVESMPSQMRGTPCMAGDGMCANIFMNQQMKNQSQSGQAGGEVSSGTSASGDPNDGKNKKKDKTYQTYTKTDPKTGKVYVGRTSGTGTPLQNIANRDKNHHRKGLTPAKLDKSSKDKNSIRGREQQLIEKNRKNGTGVDQINGIRPKNPNRKKYLNATEKEFGKP